MRLGQQNIERDILALVPYLRRGQSGAPGSVVTFYPLQARLISTAWDGDAYSTTSKTIIDLSAVFSVPAGVKAIYVSMAIRDSGSAANDCWIVLGPTDTALEGLYVDCSGLADNAWERDNLIVPCNANGDIYYQTSTSATGSMDIHLYIWGYWF